MLCGDKMMMTAEINERLRRDCLDQSGTSGHPTYDSHWEELCRELHLITVVLEVRNFQYLNTMIDKYVPEYEIKYKLYSFSR